MAQIALRARKVCGAFAFAFSSKTDKLDIKILANPGIVFLNFSVKFSVYVVCSSVLTLNNLKLHKTLAVKNIFIKEK